MKYTKTSVALAIAFASITIHAQSFCAEVTEYVTVTADIQKPGITSTPSYCEEVTEYLTVTVDLEVPQVTEAPSISSESICEAPSTVYVTESLDPTTITLSRSTAPVSTAEGEPTTTIRLTSTIEAIVTVYPSEPPAPAPTATAQESFVENETAGAGLPTDVPSNANESDDLSPQATPTGAVTPGEAVADTSAPTANIGEATFYGGSVDGGMCSLTGYKIPSGIFGTALSDSNWDGADACGACVEVTGPNGNKIKAMVVDQCPGCGENHLDLFSSAFAELADPTKGVIPVSWGFVPCSITSPLTLKNKSGTSAYWFSIQVENSNTQVTKLEVSTDGSNWQEATRQPYNFFEIQQGTGTESVSVRITDIEGKVITVDDVTVASGATKAAETNF